jgi:hypothetical protein
MCSNKGEMKITTDDGKNNLISEDLEDFKISSGGQLQMYIFYKNEIRGRNRYMLSIFRLTSLQAFKMPLQT